MTYFFIISNGKIRYECLRTWSLLLSTEESVEGDIGHLDDLESDSGNISDGVTLSTHTSSFSSTKLRQPSLGTKAVIFFPFLISCTLTHFLIAELGCLASTPTFSRTIPLAWEAPAKGLALYLVPKFAFL